MTAASGARPALTRALAEIQSPVHAELARVPDEMWRLAAVEAGLVAEVAGHLMGMRGKMFRPTLLLLSSAVDGPPPPRAVTLAAVTELIHLATLVHDDSVDHSALRRGQPTVNSAFSHQISVIMGDFLYVRALAELAQDDDVETIRVLTRASTEMSLGEMRQLGAVETLAFSEQDYERLIRAKTASLFSAACEVGAIAGGGRYRRALARFGECLGMAFQVTDDLLDFTEEASVTGKPSGLDLREHKMTLPLIAALRAMDDAARARVERLFTDDDPADALVAEVTAAVTEHGGLEYARRQAERYGEEAELALAALPDGPVRAALGETVTYVLERRS